MKLSTRYESAFNNYVKEHNTKIKTLNWFYGAEYEPLSKTELHKSFNGLYLSSEKGNNCTWLKKKYEGDRNFPEDWYILK